MRDPEGDRCPRILLVRHGLSSHVQKEWIDADGFRRWREAYEAKGIVETDRAPASLMELAGRADLIVSSDAPRAVDSARRLARGREVTVSSLMRELALEGPRSGSVRLPLRAWALAVGVKMLAMKLRGSYPSPDDAARVNEAARWLDDLAARHSTIVVVTHASLRRQLANRLVKRDWRSEERPSARHWSVWPLSR